MAKKKDNPTMTIPEYIDHMVENDIVEKNGSPEECFETYAKYFKSIEDEVMLQCGQI